MSEPASNGFNDKDLREQKRKEFDEITKSREEILQGDKERKEKRIEGEAALLKNQQTEYLKEVTDERARWDEREEWRQGQHRKRREEAEEKRKEKLELERQKILHDKQEAAKAEREKGLTELHKKAAKNKVTAKIDAAKHEEEVQKKGAAHHEERQIHETDVETDRKLAHFEGEFRKKKLQLQTQAEKQRMVIEDTARRERDDVKKERQGIELEARHQRDQSLAAERVRDARLDESRKIMQVDSRKKHSLFTLEEKLQEDLHMVDVEADRFRLEIKREADQMAQRSHRDADKIRKEAEARRQGVEDWYHRGDKKLIKDHLDLS